MRWKEKNGGKLEPPFFTAATTKWRPKRGRVIDPGRGEGGVADRRRGRRWEPDRSGGGTGGAGSTAMDGGLLRKGKWQRDLGGVKGGRRWCTGKDGGGARVCGAQWRAAVVHWGGRLWCMLMELSGGGARRLER